MLEVTENGKKNCIGQSGAIERFLANKFNVFGQGDLERARVDMIAEQVNDLFRNLVGIYSHIYYKRSGYEDKKAELEKTLTEMPTKLKLIQNLLEANNAENNNSGFLVGNSISLADIKHVNLYDWFHIKKDEILNQVPLLKQHYEKIRNFPKLKAHYENSDKMRVTIYF